MTTRVGINGFGRIGRQVLRAIKERHPDSLQVVAINDLTDTATNAHMFRYDSSYGIYPGSVEATSDDSIAIDGDEVKVMAERDPSQLPWADHGVDIVVESTGFFTDASAASGHKAGRRKEGHHLRARHRGPGATIVLGVNEGTYDPPAPTTSFRTPRARPTALRR